MCKVSGFYGDYLTGFGRFPAVGIIGGKFALYIMGNRFLKGVGNGRRYNGYLLNHEAANTTREHHGAAGLVAIAGSILFW